MPRKGEKKLYTPEQLRHARELFANGATRDEIAWQIGSTRSILEARLRDQLRDCRPGRGRGGHRPPTIDPTPEEIALACAEFRRGWPESRWLPEPRAESS